MAKNEKTTSLLGLLAFIAIIIKAVSYILSHFGGGLGVIGFAADIILTVVSLIVAWKFAKTCSKFWKIIYLVIVILTIVGFVFGGLSL